MTSGERKTGRWGGGTRRREKRNEFKDRKKEKTRAKLGFVTIM